MPGIRVSAIISTGLDVNTADEVKNKTLVRTVVLCEIPKGVCNVSFSRLFPPYLLTSTSLKHPTSIFRRINLFFSFKETVGYLSQQIPKSGFKISKKLLYWQWTLEEPLSLLCCTVEFEGSLIEQIEHQACLLAKARPEGVSIFPSATVITNPPWLVSAE